MKEMIIQIIGINQGNQIAQIKQVLHSKLGIEKFVFNGQKQISVRYNANLISEENIIRTVKETGVIPSVIKNQDVILQNNTKINRPKIFLMVSGLLTALAFLIMFFNFSSEISNIIFSLAIVIGIFYPTRKTLVALKSLNFTNNLIMIIGVLGTVLLGLLDEAALLVFIYSLGNVLEMFVTDRARDSLKDLSEQMPREGLVKQKDGEKLIPIKDIEINDLVVIKPGEKIPIDGIIKTGSSFVNESSITGESTFVKKKEKDVIYAGTINQNGILEAITTKIANETTFAKIIQSVEEIKANKSTHERFVQKFDNYFTPGMLLLGILVALSPIILGGSFYSAMYKGLILFVVSCSCGLALSVPIAVVSATINGSRNGILFKGGSYLEVAQKIKVIAFDKTGTLTFGKPTITDIIKSESVSEIEFWSIIESIESRSSHPIANAIVKNLPIININHQQITSFESLNGLGIKASLKNEQYFIGNRRFYSNNETVLKPFQTVIHNLENEGKTVVVLGKKDKILGIIGILDKLRPESTECVEQFQKMGIKVAMLTGDNEKTAKLIASQIKLKNYYTELLPEMKVKQIERLKFQYGEIAMVGDGINDTPAMVKSDVGIAMGAIGSDTAIETGDIVLMSDDLGKLPYVIKLSKRTINNIRENVIFSFATILILISFTLAGWISLVPGLLLNEASGILACLNALRLLK